VQQQVPWAAQWRLLWRVPSAVPRLVPRLVPQQALHRARSASLDQSPLASHWD
jgi:hypothetical protein